MYEFDFEIISKDRPVLLSNKTLKRRNNKFSI